MSDIIKGIKYGDKVGFSPSMNLQYFGGSSDTTPTQSNVGLQYSVQSDGSLKLYDPVSMKWYKKPEPLKDIDEYTYINISASSTTMSHTITEEDLSDLEDTTIWNKYSVDYTNDPTTDFKNDTAGISIGYSSNNTTVPTHFDNKYYFFNNSDSNGFGGAFTLFYNYVPILSASMRNLTGINNGSYHTFKGARIFRIKGGLTGNVIIACYHDERSSDNHSNVYLYFYHIKINNEWYIFYYSFTNYMGNYCTAVDYYRTTYIYQYKKDPTIMIGKVISYPYNATSTTSSSTYYINISDYYSVQTNNGIKNLLSRINSNGTIVKYRKTTNPDDITNYIFDTRNNIASKFTLNTIDNIYKYSDKVYIVKYFSQYYIFITKYPEKTESNRDCRRFDRSYDSLEEAYLDACIINSNITNGYELA